MRKLGCSPLLFGLGIVLLVLTIISFINGAIGSSFIGEVSWLKFVKVDRPHVSLPTEPIFHISGFPISNTVLAAWLSMIALIALFTVGTRKMKLVPKGLQNFLEFVVEVLANLVEGVAGKQNGRRFFPVIATIFLFVIFNAYLSLFPGFGTILVIEGEEKKELLRAANTDINLPLALALVSFAFVEYWGVTTVGFFRYLGKFFAVRNLLRGKPMGLIDVFVGLLELVSELVRIVSFTFRLFGNMTAGEILFLIVFFLWAWGVAIGVYFLEMLVGIVQALIFSLLTLVFAVLAVAAHGHPEEGKEHKSH